MPPPWKDCAGEARARTALALSEVCDDRRALGLRERRDMDTLVVKVVVPPVLIGAASLAGRRWGQAVSGWFVGLPLTSGPIAFFVALDHGVSFAAATALGALSAAMAEAAFCLAYGHAARRAG